MYLDCVILITGQSNALGYNTKLVNEDIDDRILIFNINRKNWEIYKDINYCFGYSFAKTYVNKHKKRKIGIIIVGGLGQSICNWVKNKEDELYRSNSCKIDTGILMELSIMNTEEAMCQLTGKNTIDCILWHQGEADYNESNLYYYWRLKRIIDRYRKEIWANDKTPFIAGELMKGEYDNQNTALKALNYDKDEASGCIECQYLEGSDSIHYDTTSHEVMGILYYKKYRKLKSNSIINLLMFCKHRIKEYEKIVRTFFRDRFSRK